MSRKTELSYKNTHIISSNIYSTLLVLKKIANFKILHTIKHLTNNNNNVDDPRDGC